MAKIPFDIKYRDKIESGEYKVEFDGKPARIICWDKKRSKDKATIVALVDDGESEHTEYFFSDGIAICINAPALKLVTPEEELTPFEKAFDRIAMRYAYADKIKDNEIEVCRKNAKELLELARRELKDKNYEYGFIDGKAEAFKEIFNEVFPIDTPTTIAELLSRLQDSSIASYNHGFDEGKKVALKDLPRWGDNWDSLRPYKDISGLQYIVLNGKAMNVSNLTKLPGFKEDEE